MPAELSLCDAPQLARASPLAAVSKLFQTTSNQSKLIRMLSHRRLLVVVATLSLVLGTTVYLSRLDRPTRRTLRTDKGRSRSLSMGIGLQYQGNIVNTLDEQDIVLSENDEHGSMDDDLRRFQPTVTVVEKDPATKMLGSLSMAEGSPWCQGLPTMWFVGHQSHNERPWCQQPDGSWNESQTALLETSDDYSAAKGKRAIDRHDCAAMDINGDGLVDAVCLVGAGKGNGVGQNEVYLSQSDGSLKKIRDNNLGVSKYPTMRTRMATTLRGPNDRTLLFMGVKGATLRADGAYNQHLMLRNDYQSPEQRPWFNEVHTDDDAPWKVHSDVFCAVAVDITGNGVDDLVLCQHPQAPVILTQSVDGEWSKLQLPDHAWTRRWGNVRVADVTGDGVKDLVAVDQGRAGSKLYVFKGQEQAPYFDFDHPWYKADLTNAAPDLEIMDVNNDGKADLYVVQTNQMSGYCRGGNLAPWGKGVQPKASWVPPADTAQDVLFVGSTDGFQFKRVDMAFAKNGCGSMALRFGSDRRMVYGNGDMGHPGYHMFLEWGDGDQ